MDCSLYTVSGKSVRYEHPEGIVITRADAEIIRLEIELQTKITQFPNGFELRDVLDAQYGLLPYYVRVVIDGVEVAYVES